MKYQHVASAVEMQHLDQVVMKEFGLLSEILMERAGLACAQYFMEVFPKPNFKRVLVLSGPGNNGGDGFVIARYLWEAGYEVNILSFSSKRKYKGEAKKNLTLALKLGIPYQVIKTLQEFQKYFVQTNPAVIVDALFGTGLSRNLSGLYAEVIERINKYKIERGTKVFSVDLPSGVSADTGEILGTAVVADVTATFECLKHGLLNYPGKEFAGEVKILSIGYPWRYLYAKGYEPKAIFINEELIKFLFKPRKGYFHKSRAGHLLVFAGSKGKSGAGYLTALGALRAGAGLVTLATPSSLQTIYATMLPEALTYGLPEWEGEPDLPSLEILETLLAGKKALVIGPGFGLKERAQRLLFLLLEKTTLPLVLDADALTILAQDLTILSQNKNPRILTPHPGEAARLLKLNVTEILRNRVYTAQELATQTNSVVVLKGPHSIIATPEGRVYYSPFDVPGLAQGGTGDVLSGIIGALLAQGYNSLESALLGVYLHGKAGKLLSELKGPHGFTASEVANHLPSVIKRMANPYD